MRSISAWVSAPPLVPDACVCAQITGADSEERTRIAAKNTLSFNNHFVLIFQILRTEVLIPQEHICIIDRPSDARKELDVANPKPSQEDHNEQAILVLQNSMHLM